MIKPDKTTYGEPNMEEIREWLKKNPDGEVVISFSDVDKLVVMLIDGELMLIPVIKQ